jgi:Tol biopolymer transport system component
MIAARLTHTASTKIVAIVAALVVAGCGGGGGGTTGVSAPPVPGIVVFQAVDPATPAPIQGVRELFAAVDDGSRLYKLNQDLPFAVEVNLFAISPDKKLVAFSVTTNVDQNALYVVPIEGGTPVLVSDPIISRILDILWAPDSRSLVWQGDAVPGPDVKLELWVATPDGSDQVRPVSTGLLAQIDPASPGTTEDADAVNPKWSANSRYLGFQVQTTTTPHIVGIRVVDMQNRQPDNSPLNNGELITTPAIYPVTAEIENDPGWSWSPDSSAVAYVADPATDNKRELFVSTADGVSTTKLHPTPTGNGVVTYAWAPDSSKIAYVSTQTGNKEVWLSNADGTGNERQHTDLTGGLAASNVKWSPAGQLAYLSAQTLPGLIDLFLVTDKNLNQQLVRQRFAGNKVVSYEWFEGSTRVIYFANAESTARFELWTMGTNEFHNFTVSPHPVPFNDPLAGSDTIHGYLLNPQRDRVAYLVVTGSGEFRLLAKPINGGAEIQVNDTLAAGGPYVDWKSWSPGGQRLGYTVRTGADTALFSNDAVGGKPVMLNGNKAVVSNENCCRY